MPTSVLREYVEQIDSNGFPVTMVLRGFINGMSCPEPTIEFVREVLSEERECFENCDLKNVGIEIDPLKYAEFQISSVPSFAWYRYDQRQKISGAVPIQYVIDRIK